jgi:TM2 domain-containing membrane protein YozV
VGEQKPATTRTVVAKTPGFAVGASMIIPGFGQLYANAVVLGVIFVGGASN